MLHLQQNLLNLPQPISRLCPTQPGVEAKILGAQLGQTLPVPLLPIPHPYLFLAKTGTLHPHLRH